MSFAVPFVCGARDLGEALRRIGEGAAMIRSKGEAGTGNIVEAVRHLRAITDGIRRLTIMPEEELMAEAKNLGAPYELVREVREPEAAAGGALLRGRRGHPGRRGAGDAARLRMASSSAPASSSRTTRCARGKAIVKATTHFEDPAILAEVSRGLGEPMRGIELQTIPERRS